MSVLIITGASGVGKTTTVRRFASVAPPGVRVFHFDDIGIPDWSTVPDYKAWQRETTRQWVERLVHLSTTEGVDLVLEGSSEIHCYREAFERLGFTAYEIVLFDCAAATMGERLAARGQPELYHQDMINWLRHLRGQAVAQGIAIIRTDEVDIDRTCRLLEQRLAAHR